MIKTGMDGHLSRIPWVSRHPGYETRPAAARAGQIHDQRMESAQRPPARGNPHDFVNGALTGRRDCAR